MPFRKTFKKKYTPKKRVTFRKRRGTSFKKPLIVRDMDDSVQRLNTSKSDMRPVKFVKRIDEANSDNFGTSAAIGTYKNWIFDPSGTYGNTGTGAGAVICPDWNHLIALYDQYKVDKIVIRLRANDTTAGGLTGSPPAMLIRYNYDSAGGPTTISLMNEQKNIIRKSFTADSPTFEYSIYPKCDTTLYNPGLLAAQGRAIKKAPFIDVDYPCSLWGVTLMLEKALTSTQTITTSYEYHLSMRYSV